MKNTKAILVAVIVVVIVGAGVMVILLPPLAPEEQLEIAVMLPANINDFGFNYEMYHSATWMDQQYPDVVIDVFLEVGQARPSIQAVAEELIDAGYDILISHGGGAWFSEFAVDFPDTIFVVTILPPDEVPNTFGYAIGNHEGAYVLGYLAAAITKTGEIGYMDGFQMQFSNALGNAYYFGARLANATVNVSYVWANVWEDMDLAREQAQALIDTDVDIILARTSVPGAIQAVASNPGTYIFGGPSDQKSLAPTSYLAGLAANHSRLIQELIDIYQGDGFTVDSSFGFGGPEFFLFDYKSQGAYTAWNDQLFLNDTIVSPSIRNEVLGLEEAILNGSLYIPYNDTQQWP